MTDIWGEKPESENVTCGCYHGEQYDAEEMDVWLINLKAHYETIEKQAKTLKLLFGDKGVKTENLMKIQVWREKAEKWDAAVEWANSELDKIVDDGEPCVDVGVWCTVLRKNLIICSDKLEAIKTYTEREFKAGYLIKPIDILKILEAEA